MKVLMLNNLAYEAGGAERVLRLARDGLRARGHEVEVVATDLHLPGHESFADVLVPHITGSVPRRLAAKLWHRPAYRAVRDAVHRLQPDVVHVHTVGELSPAALAAARRVPTVLTLHGPEDFTLRLLPWQLQPGSFRGGSYDVRDLTASGRLRLAHLRWVERPAYRLALRKVPVFLAPSRFMADALAADVPAARVRVLANGVPLPECAPLPTTGPLVFVGRLEVVKGVAALLEAMALVVARLPDARLTLVGSGSAEPELRRRAAELGLSQAVTFAGWLDQAGVRAQLAAGLALALPSLWPEAFGMVAVEAMAVGRPVVAFRVGGVADLVQDGVNGYLVPPGDVPALAGALVRVLTDPALPQLSRAARATAERFDVETFLDGLLVHYDTVVAAHEPAGRSR